MNHTASYWSFTPDFVIQIIYSHNLAYKLSKLYTDNDKMLFSQLIEVISTGQDNNLIGKYIDICCKVLLIDQMN